MATVERPRKARKGKLGPERWDDWKKHLAKRAKPVPLAKLIAVKQSAPLQWALPAEVRNSEAERLIVRLRNFKPRTAADAVEVAVDLEQWLDAVRVREASAPFAFEALAWCHALPRLAQALPTAPWSQLVEQLVGIATDATHGDLLAAPLAQQLLAGELPLSLAYLFPELAGCKALAAPARATLSLGLTELLDGEGTPHANYLPIARSLFACWTRCHYMGRTMKRNCFTKEAKIQYDWLIRQMMLLCRNDGTQVLSTATDGDWCPPLFEAALTLASNAQDVEIANCILPARKAPRKPRVAVPRPATNSEWAELAVLRRDWDRSGDQLMVCYANRELQLELNCGSETVFSGITNPELRVDGRLLEQEQDWEEVCWHSDSDLDYLELEGRFAHGWKVQRQFMLTRDDRFLLLADAVLGPSTAAIDHQFTLPLRDGISFVPADETREGVLRGRKPIGAVLPLQLPEWRAEHDEGSLAQTSGGLRLRQKTRGQCLFAPLFMDLKPKRFSRQLTWRRLTVAQQLEILPASVAVGYRVQTGSRQWIAYRSLAPTAARSVLGQHFSGEFVLGRFPEKGELEPLIEID